MLLSCCFFPSLPSIHFSPYTESYLKMKTFSTSLALATLAASAAAVPALVERNNDNKYQGTPGGTVKFGNGPPVRRLRFATTR